MSSSHRSVQVMGNTDRGGVALSIQRHKSPLWYGQARMESELSSFLFAP
jgi:hypothetical protein